MCRSQSAAPKPSKKPPNLPKPAACYHQSALRAERSQRHFGGRLGASISSRSATTKTVSRAVARIFGHAAGAVGCGGLGMEVNRFDVFLVNLDPTTVRDVSKIIYFHCKIPFAQAQTRPSTRRRRKTINAKNAASGSFKKAAANGRRKIVSTSKMRKTRA